MKANRTLCKDIYFNNARAILSAGPLPTFVLAGDNEFLDCPDLDAAWESYQQYFVVNPFENQWSVLPEGVPALNVTRWTQKETVPVEDDATRTAANPEMFSFVEDGIIFMSLTVMSDDSKNDFQSDAWHARLADSTYWVSQRVAAATR